MTRDEVLNMCPLVVNWSESEVDGLAQLGEVPNETEVNEYKLMELSEFFLEYDHDAEMLEAKIVEKSREFLANGRAEEAWKCLLALNI